MDIKQQINADLKTAMLAGDKPLVTALRTLKSAILYAEVASDKRDEGLPNKETISLLRKEAKKRQESSELFAQGGNKDKAESELYELDIINKYLPAQMDDVALGKLVDDAIEQVGADNVQAIGLIIKRVKELSAGAADGGRIATFVKEKLAK